MRDLVRESGLPRETIHFYRQQGLLPEPVKTGRNTALYTQEHVERLRRIRELQERQFLPLKAIRAVLDDTAEEDFTPEQEDLVRQVRATLSGWSNDQQRPAVAVADFVPDRLSRGELRELTDAGLVTVQGAGTWRIRFGGRRRDPRVLGAVQGSRARPAAGRRTSGTAHLRRGDGAARQLARPGWPCAPTPDRRPRNSRGWSS